MKSLIRKLTLTLTLLLFFSVFTFSATESIPAKDHSIIREAILQNYVTPIEPEKLETITPEILEALLDENSYYLTSQQMKEIIEGFQGAFEGIGIYIFRENGDVIVSETIPDSPAFEAGILSRDRIVAVDGMPTAPLSLDQVVRRIKGPKGSTVVLGIRRSGQDEIIEFEITRQSIQVSSVDGQVIEEEIGYLEVRQFSEDTTRNTKKILEEFQEAGINKLVIDLRNNPGGLLNEGINFSRLLIPPGPITHVLYREGEITYSSFNDDIPYETAVVLVNEGSASAAEIFAAAFKERGTGIIIGQPTYGKGSVQRLYPLPSGGGFKLTEAAYFSPFKRAIDGKGVYPDIDLQRFHPSIQLEDIKPLGGERRLSVQDEGEDVLAAQQRLQLLGYAIEDPEGIFGSSTQAAVANFQRAQGIFSYGVLDFSTQRRLNREFQQWLIAPEQDLQLKTAIDYLKGQRSSHENAKPVKIN
ncbi:carboxyl-terminal processing protease [Tindallia magadiensis]|uniref:Carboxyl-terminal processing protease n=1 Tax=Tindallia magadiensis TaxID=69895 RepID=A0A1I3D0I8_9FIRM|nr:S41 family peptidase [Tindallia magadiensis]SFH80223.1 carboxyl-terminal processing protease [Tindallia magadiensis]